MRAQQPALEQRDHQMHVGQQFDGIFGLLSDDGGLAPIALVLQSLVPLPAVGVNGTARLDGILDERLQTGGGSVRDRT